MIAGMTTSTVRAAKLREGVAEEIRVLLARKRMSGSALAHEIGQSQSYVSRRLNGSTAFDLDDLEQIARVLEVSVTALLPKMATEVAVGGGVMNQSFRSSGSAGRGSTRPTDNRPSGRARSGDARPIGRPGSGAVRRPRLIGDHFDPFDDQTLAPSPSVA